MKVCVIGLGRMGRRHLQVILNLGFKISGIFDTLDESIALAQKEYDLSSSVIFNSIDLMFQKIQPDAVVIASTAPSHCEYVCKSAEAGVRYILCEKPMAVSLEECNQMINACQKAGSTLAINHQMQFMDQYVEIKNLAESEMFGGIRSINIIASNFGFAMNAVHYFEMFRYVTGQELIEVNAWLDGEYVPNPRGPEFEDRSGQIRAVSEDGVRLFMEAGGDLGHGIQVVYSCRLGQIVVDELAGYVRYSHRKTEFSDLPTTRYGMPSNTEVLSIEPADVIGPTEGVWKAMLDSQDFPDAYRGKHAVAALIAVNLSGEQGGITTSINNKANEGRVFKWA